MLIFRLNFEIFSFQLLYFIMVLIFSVGGKTPLSQMQAVNIQHTVLMLLVLILLMKKIYSTLKVKWASLCLLGQES